MNWPTLNQVVSRAQSNLGMTSDEQRVVMRKNAKVIMEKMGLFYLTTQETCLDIGSDGIAKKPAGFLAPLWMRVSVAGANHAIPNYQPWVSDNCGCETNPGCHITVGENDCFFFVDPAEEGKLYLRYYSYPCDDSGEILVPLYAEDAIAAGIEAKQLVIRQRREGYRMIPNSMIQDARQQYEKLFREAVSRKNTPKPGEEGGIAGVWLTMQPQIYRQLSSRINTLF